MAASKEITLTGSEHRIDEIAAEAESFGRYMGLSEKNVLRLRLLSEETVGMAAAISGEFAARWQIFSQNDIFTVHLEADTPMNTDKREKLLNLGSSGKNEVAKGVMGKIREVFEKFLFTPNAPLSAGGTDYCGATIVNAAYIGGMDMEPAMASYWSLEEYRRSVSNELRKDLPAQDAQDAWDELERSIVANIADDVRIGIQSGHVVMDIEKSFK